MQFTSKSAKGPIQCNSFANIPTDRIQFNRKRRTSDSIQFKWRLFTRVNQFNSFATIAKVRFNSIHVQMCQGSDSIQFICKHSQRSDSVHSKTSQTSDSIQLICNTFKGPMQFNSGAGVFKVRLNLFHLQTCQRSDLFNLFENVSEVSNVGFNSLAKLSNPIRFNWRTIFSNVRVIPID